MKHQSLATRYRPQNFSEVIGQTLATTALSRAAAEDKVAPAYLLSGTRGVGKTTIARIFAKALNCEHAPAAEPCNVCPQCRHITGGNHVDVNEIDGASNTGVDDVRALRETIGYMPMEGRYKIFIIDEAHMLSKNAFNALLKTLEEPPPYTVFIFATTEAHRFPATIVSRCQHFVFRSLPEEQLFEHLSNILGKEGIPYESGALRLIARRAAGSVRDSLSLLDQVLAMADGKLLEASTREALGLAGSEFFEQLFQALPGHNCARVVSLSGQLLQTGTDIGFFTRELASWLRNLFLFRQTGESIIPILGLSSDEVDFVRAHASAFSLAHLHAAWQMTLESQRTIAQSPDPGSSLELLLLHLALLPQLLPLAELGPPDKPESSPPKTEELPRWKMEENTAKTNFVPRQPPEAAHAPKSYSWQGFCEFCTEEEKKGAAALPKDLLRQLRVSWQNNIIEISLSNQTLKSRLDKYLPLLKTLLKKYGDNADFEVKINSPRNQQPVDNIARCENTDEIKMCAEILGARVTECWDIGRESS